MKLSEIKKIIILDDFVGGGDNYLNEIIETLKEIFKGPKELEQKYPELGIVKNDETVVFNKNYSSQNIIANLSYSYDRFKNENKENDCIFDEKKVFNFMENLGSQFKLNTLAEDGYCLLFIDYCVDKNENTVLPFMLKWFYSQENSYKTENIKIIVYSSWKNITCKNFLKNFIADHLNQTKFKLQLYNMFIDWEEKNSFDLQYDIEHYI